jgi:hypothetical protein
MRGRGLTRTSEPDRVASPRAAHPVSGAGLGLRRALFDALDSADLSAIDFMEVAPENWMRVGGRLGRRFRSSANVFRWCVAAVAVPRQSGTARHRIAGSG